MEILIIGGIIVALMAYASTKIKKSAAQAYEEETVAADEFALVKPAGFLNPIRDRSEFAFEAYSKEFGGREETERLRQAEARLRVLTDQDFTYACEQARGSVDKILSEEINNGPGAIKSFRLAGEKTKDNVEIAIYRRLVAARQKIFDLEVTVLKDSQDAFADKADKLLDSFRVK